MTKRTNLLFNSMATLSLTGRVELLLEQLFALFNITLITGHLPSQEDSYMACFPSA